MKQQDKGSATTQKGAQKSNGGTTTATTAKRKKSAAQTAKTNAQTAKVDAKPLNAEIKAKSTTAAQRPTLPSEPATHKTAAELIKQRLDKRTKLETLYKDIDQLEQALQEFNRISGYGDVRVQITCSGHTFSTTRQDTVDATLVVIRESIANKLEQAHSELAAFEF